MKIEAYEKTLSQNSRSFSPMYNSIDFSIIFMSSHFFRGYETWAFMKRPILRTILTPCYLDYLPDLHLNHKAQVWLQGRRTCTGLVLTRRLASDVPICLFSLFFYLARFQLKWESKQSNRFDSSQNGYWNRPIRLIWLPKQADMAAKMDR